MKSKNKSKNFSTTVSLQLTLVSMFCLHFFLMNAKQCYASQSVWEKLAPMKEQYQKIKTLHVKSSMLVESGRIDSPNTSVTLIDYEHWEDSNGCYKTVYGFMDANGPIAGSYWEYAYNGQTFYAFEKQSKIASYSATKPNTLITPENPLLSPLLFLKDASDNSSLQLSAIRNSEKWQSILEKSECIKDSNSTKEVIKIASRKIDNSKFDSYLYFAPNGLVENIKSVGVEDSLQSSSIKICEYQHIILSGKKTYWPKTVEITGTDLNDKSTVKLTAQIDLVEINTILPDKIFTVDISFAKSVWNEDTKMFVK
ncbi:MAG: hypothetical protein PHQ00_06675 [Phycisphaerae bacterium]|nr:hypothetical protein [Phycisphaerae bacterium]